MLIENKKMKKGLTILGIIAIISALNYYAYRVGVTVAELEGIASPMNVIIVSLEVIGFPLILITLSILFAWPAPKFVIVRQLLFITLVPLMFLVAYLVFGYQTSIWFIFGRYSWAPYLIAAAAFLVSFGVVLARASVPLYSKAILAAVTIVSWVIFSFITTFFTVCIMGDCL